MRLLGVQLLTSKVLTAAARSFKLSLSFGSASDPGSPSIAIPTSASTALTGLALCQPFSGGSYGLDGS